MFFYYFFILFFILGFLNFKVLSEELGLTVDRSMFVFSVYIFRIVDVHGDGLPFPIEHSKLAVCARVESVDF